MVMESPSAQSVGREFVRQYYTLMNEAPEHLHRFYSSSSSFIHSGVEGCGDENEPVYGQKAIHQKIKQMNFEDCHTKIRQVDSQETVDDGVVVQVTGELSNHGGPMRRFMQTFVLAHQNPKQYYVHNDIFRYQDDVFRDYEQEDGVESSTPASGLENGEVPTEAVANGSVQPEQLEVREEVPAAEEVKADPQPDHVAENSALVPEVEPTSVEPQVPASVDTSALGPQAHQPTKEVNHEPEPAIVDTQVNAAGTPAKPNSWATVAASQGGPGTPVIPTGPVQGKPVQAVLPLATISAQQRDSEENILVSSPPSTLPDVQTVSHSGKTSRGSAESTRPPRHDFGPDKRTNEKYPDNHQIFVGNLPLDVADLELKRFFATFGRVLDVRVNRNATGGKVPFGFVVFDSDAPVNQLLQLKRVEMTGHRLNVEEKKARNDRTGSNSRSRGQRSNQRGNSRPKDRENSGSRSDNRLSQNRKYPRS